MHSTNILLSIAALAGTSLSQTSDSAFCNSLVSSFFNLLETAPTTPADILSFIATATGIPPLPTTIDPSGHQDQLCAIATALPSSLLPEFQTFAATLLLFGHEHNSELVEYITDCLPEPEAASMTSYLDHVFTATGNICTETSATAAPGSGSSASNSTYATGTGSVYPTATSSFTLIPTAAAAKPTGALARAAAVGGVVGAAALL
ncbi:hypothetical protein E0Z10_g6282 [Xylaria hypoxylon]|uniref:Infection structure specific protein n=1 Tax=Xylaria hypoxylon TaxID=37992 RepID=A0A4Z0Z1H2_9PEZI|nr:hypothetical protein E0Z10_g6282 [Xylaria hypoxylon]